MCLEWFTDVLVDFIVGTSVCDAARAVHGEGRWRDQDIKISCLMSTWSHLVAAQKEWEEICIHRGELEQTRSELWAREQESKSELNESDLQARSDFMAYKNHMDDLTRRMNEQLELLEVIRCTAKQEMLQQSRNSSPLDATQSRKIMKPSVFPAFSGEEPTPKDECGIETFLYQVKGAIKSVTDQVIRSALVTSWWGGDMLNM